ncbi:adenylate kinase [Goodfellowiella coeruleoviolacea]|uniref:Adenylate kinase n=1 Tax=Goodfellowiella coeruleoviolacea TaxID=334858 RepID=A0AAE3GKX6_9PSEU|nr:adenylate kinase [Goodfellowiella coeruleoviolacea]
MLVAGVAGSGKTTLATVLADRLDLRRIELDALHHGPQWTPRPEFVADVTRLTEDPGWVTEWQHGQVRRLLLDRADTLVWLDHPRSLVMRRVVVRTLRRWALREELWNGNREPPLRTVFTDPDHIIRWAWRGHARMAQRMAAVLASQPAQPSNTDPSNTDGPNTDGLNTDGLTVVRLSGQRQVNAWLAGPVRALAGTGLTRE